MSFRNHIESEPFGNDKKMNQLKQEQLNKINRSAFPKKYTYAGYLFIRTESNPQWRRKYFVLNNNFLLCGDNPYAERLAACVPLEGSNIGQTTKSSDMTFELTTHSQDTKKSKQNKSKAHRKRKKYYFRADSPNMCTRWTEYIERASTLSIKDIYRLRYKLGNSDSQSAKVIAAKHRVSNEEFAIKIIDKRKCDQNMLQREIQILKQLSNPYIVELCDLFETRKYLYIVMEYCKGGELFDKIANLDGDHYSEVDCCQIMHQLASGVEYMHDMGIVHRDLKPENILCVLDSIKQVKIADFGISAIVDSHTQSHSNNSTMKTRIGTLSYTAPEILAHKPYDHCVDYWSLGVIMYILVCGYPPFDGETDYNVSDAITNDRLELEDEDWNHVSKSTQDLVKKLLDKDPKCRANCNDIIENVWKVEVSNTSFKNAHRKLKQTVLKRKFGQRASYDENEEDGKIDIDKKRRSSKEKQKVSFDDLSFRKSHHRKQSNLTQKVKAEKQDKEYDSFRGKLGSKGTEHLFLEHMHPMNYRDSFVINEFDDELNKYRNNNNKNKMHTLKEVDSEEEEDEEEEEIDNTYYHKHYHNNNNNNHHHNGYHAEKSNKPKPNKVMI